MTDELFNNLHDLVSTPFFKYFRVSTLRLRDITLSLTSPWSNRSTYTANALSGTRVVFVVIGIVEFRLQMKYVQYFRSVNLHPYDLFSHRTRYPKDGEPPVWVNFVPLPMTK